MQVCGCAEQVIESGLCDIYTYVQASHLSVDSLEHPLEGQLGDAEVCTARYCDFNCIL